MATAAGTFGDGPLAHHTHVCTQPTSPSFSQHQAGISQEELQLGQRRFSLSSCPPVPFWVSISHCKLGASPGWGEGRSTPVSPMPSTGFGPKPESSKCLLNELTHFSNHIKVLFSLSSGQINPESRFPDKYCQSGFCISHRQG